MADYPSREEMDARLEALDARTDTKFAQLLGEMRTGFTNLEGKLEGKVGTLSARVEAVERATAGTKSTVIVTGIGVVAVLVGILAYGQAWFGIGVTTRDTVKSAVTEILQQQAASKPK